MGCHAPLDEVGDRRCDALRLGPIIVVGAIGDLSTTVALAGQAHRALSLRRAGQDVVGESDDLRG